MNPVMIRIMAVVGIIIGFVFMGLLYGYNEQLYASLSDHCNINSERVKVVRWGANTATNFEFTAGTSGTSGTCTYTALTFPGTSAAAADTAINTALPGLSSAFVNTSTPKTVNFETPNGSNVAVSFSFASNTWTSGTSLAVPNGGWEEAPGLGGQFRTLTFLLIAVIPLALVAAVIAQAVPLIMSGGSSNVTDIVNKQTMGLLIAAAVIIAAPIMFEQAASAKDDLVGLGSAAQFLTITNLIFDLVPLVYTIGVMGLIIYGSGLVQRFGGKQKMGGMMGM